jgi:hypothetical protein
MGGNNDRSGTILTESIVDAFNEMGIPVNTLLNKVDVNKVSFNEFLKLILLETIHRF